MKNLKQIFVVAVIGIAILIAFALPKPKYQGLNILKQINIPTEFGQWSGKDVAQDLNINDDRYKFISDIFARTYTNKEGASLLFLILDAGNFHNPKVCFGSSGYTIKELSDETIEIGARTFRTTTLYTQKPGEGYVLMYWLCIDKQITGWTGQKAKEFFSSLIGKKKAGLMVRLDIPSSEQTTSGAIALGKQFIADLSKTLSPQDLEYIFGI
ncbi:MAG TPA: EpsI family protein [Candidatus Omnitrophota bacterium]|nr:EpsI family protein [Candidatus Omnitrophota bacterium]